MRGGVPWPQDGGQRLAGLGQIAEQRVKAEAALVVAGGAFLLGVGCRAGGVDVEDQLLGPGAGLQAPPAASARAARIASSPLSSIDLITRWAVVSEATH